MHKSVQAFATKLVKRDYVTSGNLDVIYEFEC